MTYLKIYTDFLTDTKELSDTEIGRLFRFMLKYALEDTEPKIKGNERYMWASAKKNIDAQKKAYAHQCAVNKQNITNRYEPLRTVTNGNESKQEKEKEKEKDKEELNSLQSFIRSKAGRDDEDGLERTIDGAQLHLYRETEPEFTEAMENAIRTMWRAEYTKVNGRAVPREEVRSVLRRLTINHIDSILDRLRNMDPEEPVVNGQAYLMACIYNAPADFAVNNKRASWR